MNMEIRKQTGNAVAGRTDRKPSGRVHLGLMPKVVNAWHPLAQFLACSSGKCVEV